MGRGKELSEFDKGGIIALKEWGIGDTEIARARHIPRTTVIGVVKKYNETGSAENKKRSGRPPITTPRDDRNIVATARANRRTTYEGLRCKVNVEASAKTIYRRLSAAGYLRRKARRKPLLMDRHVKQRKQWLQEVAQMSPDWHKHVMWSDESYICLSDKGGDSYVTRRPNEENLDPCIVPTIKQSPIRVMVWALIAYDYKSPLVVLEYKGGKKGGMDADKYIDQVVEPHVWNCYCDLTDKRGHMYFMHDNAPSHTSTKTKKALAEIALPQMMHPANSPDLNPIENLWAVLKSRIQGRERHPNSIAELTAAAKEEWEKIDETTVNKYVDTMPERYEALKAQKGHHIPY